MHLSLLKCLPFKIWYERISSTKKKKKKKSVPKQKLLLIILLFFLSSFFSPLPFLKCPVDQQKDESFLESRLAGIDE